MIDEIDFTKDRVNSFALYEKLNDVIRTLNIIEAAVSKKCDRNVEDKRERDITSTKKIELPSFEKIYIEATCITGKELNQDEYLLVKRLYEYLEQQEA